MIEQQLQQHDLSDILIHFYNDKRKAVIQENNLLLSRWSRFCRTSFDATKFLNSFKQRQQYLKFEFSDAVNRYERLYENRSVQSEKAREAHVAEEAKRVRDERNGLAVLKDVNATKSKENNHDNQNPFQGKYLD
jgi:hypothetical protein